MQLSQHFSLEEFITSEYAVRHGIDNMPTPEIAANLTKAAAGMELVRSLLGNRPIHVNSGYRCQALNTAIGGAVNSAHLSGFAVDFICPGFGTPYDIAVAISQATPELSFDACIQEGTWLHLSFAPGKRHQFLTAKFGPHGTTYTDGLTE